MENDDHDILIRLDTKLDILQKGFDNHLAHHTKWMYIIGGSLITSAITTFVALIKLL